MKRIISVLLSVLILSTHAYSFCGFYVAKADTKLFNETSEVIYVRNGDRSTITMSNDFKGDVKDFAMVVPVPVVLEEEDIRVVDRKIFEKFDEYSGPRLVEYYDRNPCQKFEYRMYSDFSMDAEMTSKDLSNYLDIVEDDFGVSIEAEYEVGEYDILILSAKESSGLKDWLILNEYKMPEGAEEVLDPYIKDNMKFFVVKVNLDRLENTSADSPISPIQISFESKKFMLPIRLGMANANGFQDMVVYFLTQTGRVETANYRTAKIPTDRDIPTFVRNDFGKFYKNLFDRAWEREGKDAVMLEYAWDVSSNTAVKCDPCVGPPPLYADFVEAGVDWFKNLEQGQERWDGSGGDYGSAFFTRLHVRYDRDNFPQDLLFVETPNSDSFQGRYVMNNPASGDFNCDEGTEYLDELFTRRAKELKELYHLAEWDNSQHYTYLNSEPLSYKLNQEFYNDKNQRNDFIPTAPSPGVPSSGFPMGIVLTIFGILLLLYAFYRAARKREAKQSRAYNLENG